MFSPELVVLTDEAGHAIGAAQKAEVHTTQTPLHLAFSCHVLDAEGRVLYMAEDLPRQDVAAALAISVEPAGGSAQPTSQPIYVGSIGD